MLKVKRIEKGRIELDINFNKETICKDDGAILTLDLAQASRLANELKDLADKIDKESYWNN
jgi:hypothetical protein